ncbi:hypothetical protein FDE04_04475 [Vibrio parahaemolyticus]|nr:hypothetical protein [Vibrio parahaemolyticus]MQE74614.1 hypothetical protein [Vibrio parahaemolyticus]MQE95647.1 hypothetical protein [Vibrio parahaemolyticus]MQF04086.1 hypothetical protein [Vibrio parahaemolyticus]MQF18665.1 hypothetical protein [Vibrio parahaemolyticus]
MLANRFFSSLLFSSLLFSSLLFSSLLFSSLLFALFHSYPYHQTHLIVIQYFTHANYWFYKC